jgi:hypothetical protein
LQNDGNPVLILLSEEFVETSRNLPQHGVDATLNAILRMDVKFGRFGGCLRRSEREYREKWRRKKGEGNALAILEKLTAADITAFLPRPAQ